MSVEAKHEADCVACDGPIRVGEYIDRDSFSERWMHAECPKRKTRPANNERITSPEEATNARAARDSIARCIANDVVAGLKPLQSMVEQYREVEAGLKAWYQE